ncbi:MULTISPECIES: hypothetical protein [Metabacillus]|uniref:Uncharacterized protein n=1 Tax=Metabacillus elymi TaxID=2745198 RepID=A0ABX6S6C0_9BACI|nr:MULTISPECIES: hypothetical protein [Metabacillus]QNF28956.1 hypothetical protein HUW50_16600 [Metabacillus sp. KUDC1714]
MILKHNSFQRDQIEIIALDRQVPATVWFVKVRLQLILSLAKHHRHHKEIKPISKGFGM